MKAIFSRGNVPRFLVAVMVATAFASQARAKLTEVSAPAVVVAAVASADRAPVPLAPLAPAGAPMAEGKIKAFIVSGSVNVTMPDGSTGPLQKGDLIPVGAALKTGAVGTVLLVFSNGAAIQLKPNTELRVNKFEQAPYDEVALGTFVRLQKDPSKSVAVLTLVAGAVVGDVKQLNQAAGSSFQVLDAQGHLLAKDSFVHGITADGSKNIPSSTPPTSAAQPGGI